MLVFLFIRSCVATQCIGMCMATTTLGNFFFLFSYVCSGTWGVGLATESCLLDKVPLGNDPNNWVLRSDGNVCHDGDVLYTACPKPGEGDVVVSVCRLSFCESSFSIV